MARIPNIDIAGEYEEVAADVEAAVLRVLRSQRYILGPETEAFERSLAELVGVRHAIGVEGDLLSIPVRDVDHGVDLTPGHLSVGPYGQDWKSSHQEPQLSDVSITQ